MTKTIPWDTVCITGGTGSFGQAMTKHLLEFSPDVHIRIISRDEYKQILMRQSIPDSQSSRVSFLLGDIRDIDRLRLAFRNVDLVIHAAALKHVPSGEYNPFEVVQTNILGTQNVARAAIDCDVNTAVLLSSDKSCEPINLYGATKMVAEKVWSQANSYSSLIGPHFVTARYGNVMGSRGSVVEIFRHAVAEGKPIPVTDRNMTRFWLNMDEAISLVLFTASSGMRGGIHIPELASFSLGDLCDAFDAYTVSIPKRPGEKDHEVLMTDYERQRAILMRDLNGKSLYCIPPEVVHWYSPPKDMSVSESDSTILHHQYCSESWPIKLSMDAIKRLLVGM